jgi:hypothetical protein
MGFILEREWRKTLFLHSLSGRDPIEIRRRFHQRQEKFIAPFIRRGFSSPM